MTSYAEKYNAINRKVKRMNAKEAKEYIENRVIKALEKKDIK